MHKRSLALIVGLGLAASACKDSTGVGDLNNVSADALAGGLNRSSTQLLVTGLLNQTRADQGLRTTVFTETLARDFYRLDANEPRFITELLGGTADPGGFVGGGAFAGYYVTVRAANNLIDAVANATGLTDAEKSGTRGLARTFKALALYRVLETRDSLGIAVDVNKPIDAPPAEFVCKPNALAYISAQLDTAKTELAAAGGTFAFALPSGFSKFGQFNTPAAFLKFTRGLKGKVEVYRGLSFQKPNAASFDVAIAELGGSFLDTAAPMSNGMYNTYSTSAGDAVNPLADALIYLNPSVQDSIVATDLRNAKITPVATAGTGSGVSSTEKPTNSSPDSLTTPLAILKNSELILLRAQAEIEKGDLVAAQNDINAVREKDGGLPRYIVPFTTKRQAIDALLYEKRYSLLGEGAQRLVDLRAYSLLQTRDPEVSGDQFQATLPIPKSELDARNTTSITPACP